MEVAASRVRIEGANVNHEQKPTEYDGSTAVPSVARFEVRATVDSHYGWIRTRLSLERTMMSWLRTATALIGFGFAIVEFFERFHQSPEVHSAYLPNAPVYLGLALISCGVLALVVSIWYRWTVRYLWAGSFAPIAGMTNERTRLFWRLASS
jgi:putative membrane protein